MHLQILAKEKAVEEASGPFTGVFTGERAVEYKAKLHS